MNPSEIKLEWERRWKDRIHETANPIEGDKERISRILDDFKKTKDTDAPISLLELRDYFTINSEKEPIFVVPNTSEVINILEHIFRRPISLIEVQNIRQQSFAVSSFGQYSDEFSQNGPFITQRIFLSHNNGESYKHFKSTQNFLVAARKVLEVKDITARVEGTQVNLFIRDKNDDNFMLDAAGDGIKQAFFLLAMDFYAQESLILIDEPELNLHPSLLSSLLDQFLQNSKNRFILATHSGILLRSGYASSVYRITTKDHSIQCQQLDGKNDILIDLGYSEIDNILADTLVLVEGPHDVNGIRILIEKCLAGSTHTRFSVMFMGGSSMKSFQVDLLKSFFKKIFAILDNETEPSSVKARNAFKSKAQEHSVECFTLQRYSLDNYWPKSSLSLCLEKQIHDNILFPVMGKLDKEGISSTIVKRNTVLLANNTPWSEIEKTDLGPIIEKICKSLREK